MIHKVGLLKSYDFKNLLLSSAYPSDTFQCLILVLNFKHTRQ